jgi:hypothetical protein
MSMLLLNKRRGPFHLPPVKGSKEKRVFPGGTTLTVSDEEGSALLLYKDIVQVKDGKQVAGPKGADPVPAGTGVSGKADPAQKVDPKAGPKGAK